MAVKKRSTTKKSPRRAPASRGSTKRGAAARGLSETYARPRAAGLHPIPASFVGAIVDSLIRNDGARDIDVRGRSDGLFDVIRLA